MVHRTRDEDLDERGESRRTFIKALGGTTVVGSSTLLAGCSGGGGNDTPTEGGNGDGDGDGDGDGGGDGDGDGTSSVTRGGQLNVGFPLGTQTLSSFHAHAVAEVADTVAKLNPIWAESLLTANESGEFVPQLATDWEIDGGDITFTLREGVTFHPPYDYEMTAEDVRRSMIVAMGGSQTTSGMRRYVQGRFVGGDTGQTPEEAMTVNGDYEITFHADGFHVGNLLAFATSNSYIVPGQAYDDYDPAEFGQMPQPGMWGTGPFQFEESVAQGQYRFSAFDDYWGEDENGNQLPYLDGVRYDMFDNLQARYAALEAGQSDVTVGIPPNRVSDLESSSDLTPQKAIGTRLLRFGFNHTHWEPASSPAFKKGIAYALNANPMNESVMNGEADLNHAHLPSWHGLYQDTQSELETYEQDQERAMELFQESGFEPPLDQDFFIGTEQSVARDHTFLQIALQQLQEAGFEAEGEPLIDSEGLNAWNWLGSVDNPENPPEDHAAFIYGLDTLVPSVDRFIGSAYAPGWETNMSHYTGHAEMAQDAATTVDEDERLEKYREMLIHLNKEDIPEVAMMWFPHLWASTTAVRNLEVGHFGHLNLKSVWLDE